MVVGGGGGRGRFGVGKFAGGFQMTIELNQDKSMGPLHGYSRLSPLYCTLYRHHWSLQPRRARIPPMSSTWQFCNCANTQKYTVIIMFVLSTRIGQLTCVGMIIYT